MHADYSLQVTVAGDRILGYIDLRQSTSIAASSSPVNGVLRPIICIHTPERVFMVAPDTVNESLTCPAKPAVQYMLGWPVAEPEFGRELTTFSEGGAILNGGVVFETWLDTLVAAQLSEAASKKYLVTVLADSTETLPSSLLIRVAATEIALLDVADPDLAHTCWSFKDIASWSNPIPSELHFTIRVPGSMVRAVLKTDKAADIRATVETAINNLVCDADAA
jgi:hypothetical protein